MAYTAADEYPLSVSPDTPQWSENFAAFFCDEKLGVSVMYSAGRWHADPNLWREYIWVGLPGDRVLYHRSYGRTPNDKGPPGHLGRYEILVPLKSARLTFDGPVSESTSRAMIERGPLNEPPAKRLVMDLRFDSDVPIWDMKGSSHEAQTMTGAMHIDHAGVANGSIRYDGQIYELQNGYAVRDHSRGVRDMSYYGRHAWINGKFPDGVHFHVYAGAAQGSRDLGMAEAVVIQGQRVLPAKLLHVDLLTDTKQAATPHRLALESELGRMEIDVVEFMNTFPYSMFTPFDTTPGLTFHRRQASMFDEFVRLRCNGQTGVGWSERGIAPQPI